MCKYNLILINHGFKLDLCKEEKFCILLSNESHAIDKLLNMWHINVYTILHKITR